MQQQESEATLVKSDKENTIWLIYRIAKRDITTYLQNRSAESIYVGVKFMVTKDEEIEFVN